MAWEFDPIKLLQAQQDLLFALIRELEEVADQDRQVDMDLVERAKHFMRVAK